MVRTVITHFQKEYGFQNLPEQKHNNRTGITGLRYFGAWNTNRGFCTWVFSQTVSRLLIAGLGALGTILLAALTALTIQNNQVLVKEKLKDREKPIQEAVLRDVVNPSISSIRTNRSKIMTGIVEWTEVQTEPDDIREPGEVDLIGVDLETPYSNPDPVASDRFRQSYPHAARLVREYDDQVHILSNSARELLDELDEPVTEFRRDHQGITEEDHEKLINLLLNYHGGKTQSDEELPHWWVSHRSEADLYLSRQVPKYESWHDQMDDFIQSSVKVEEELIRVKKEIQSEYGIDLEISQS